MVLECVITEVWTDQGKISIVNLYNPCIKLEESYFQDIVDKINVQGVWMGDFNAHNEMWGGEKRDRNGQIVENFIDKNNLVVLNDGRPTWFGVSRSMSSSIDITIVSAELASISRWETMDLYSMGSDHVAIISKFGRCLIEEPVRCPLRLNYKRANWNKFEKQVNMGLAKIDSGKGVDEWNSSLSKMMWSAAVQNIPKKKIPVRREMVPWWTEECDLAVRDRNRAYKKLKKHLLENYAIEYKRLRAKARRVIKDAKKHSWKTFCNKLGLDTPLKKIWNPVHRMTGIYRQTEIPVLHCDGEEAVNSTEKASMLVKQLQKVHSSKNVDELNRKRRYQISRGNMAKLLIDCDNSDYINVAFSTKELQKAIIQGKDTSPGMGWIRISIV